MKRLRRSFFPAIFSFLILLSIAFNLHVTAQQTPKTAEPPAAAARLDADSVVLNVTVTNDKDDYIDGLDKSAFAIYENKVPQEITAFAGADEPVSIGIIFDLSGSVVESKSLKLAQQAVLRFIEQSNSANDYCVIAFTARPLVLIDWSRNGKAVAQQLSRYYFTRKNAKGISLNTALYDSFYLGLEKMRGGAHTKQAILLIADGQDNESRYTYSEVRARLKETGVLLYSIGIYGGNDPASVLTLDNHDALDGLSAISGGKAYFPESEKEIAEIFDRIATELRHQYVLGFKPSKAKADGKWHQIKIKVTPPLTASGKKQRACVRSKESYYAIKSLR